MPPVIPPTTASTLTTTLSSVFSTASATLSSIFGSSSVATLPTSAAATGSTAAAASLATPTVAAATGSTAAAASLATPTASAISAAATTLTEALSTLGITSTTATTAATTAAMTAAFATTETAVTAAITTWISTALPSIAGTTTAVELASSITSVIMGSSSTATLSAEIATILTSAGFSSTQITAAITTLTTLATEATTTFTTFAASSIAAASTTAATTTTTAATTMAAAAEAGASGIMYYAVAAAGGAALITTIWATIRHFETKGLNRLLDELRACGYLHFAHMTEQTDPRHAFIGVDDVATQELGSRPTYLAPLQSDMPKFSSSEKRLLCLMNDLKRQCRIRDAANSTLDGEGFSENEKRFGRIITAFATELTSGTQEWFRFRRSTKSERALIEAARAEGFLCERIGDADYTVRRAPPVAPPRVGGGWVGFGAAQDAGAYALPTTHVPTDDDTQMFSVVVAPNPQPQYAAAAPSSPVYAAPTPLYAVAVPSSGRQVVAAAAAGPASHYYSQIKDSTGDIPMQTFSFGGASAGHAAAQYGVPVAVAQPQYAQASDGGDHADAARQYSQPRAAAALYSQPRAEAAAARPEVRSQPALVPGAVDKDDDYGFHPLYALGDGDSSAQPQYAQASDGDDHADAARPYAQPRAAAAPQFYALGGDDSKFREAEYATAVVTPAPRRGVAPAVSRPERVVYDTAAGASSEVVAVRAMPVYTQPIPREGRVGAGGVPPRARFAPTSLASAASPASAGAARGGRGSDPLGRYEVRRNPVYQNEDYIDVAGGDGEV